MLSNIKKKNRLQDPKSIGLSLLVVLSLGRTSFFVFQIDFRCIAVRNFYHFWCLLAITRYDRVNEAKKCWKKQTVKRLP